MDTSQKLDSKNLQEISTPQPPLLKKVFSLISNKVPFGKKEEFEPPAKKKAPHKLTVEESKQDDNSVVEMT